MLEKISNRRVINTHEDEKIVVNGTMFNELTALSKFSIESYLKRRHKKQAYFYVKSKIENKKAIHKENCREIFPQRTLKTERKKSDINNY